jgi:hypothetical protein
MVSFGRADQTPDYVGVMRVALQRQTFKGGVEIVPRLEASPSKYSIPSMECLQPDCELRDYSAGLSPLDRNTAHKAIIMPGVHSRPKATLL